MFVCLNPSTADAETEDNTSRVCINYAKRWGYGGLLIGNLFAYCSTDQSALYQVTDPIGPENDAWLKKLPSEAALVVCAWSDTGAYKDRDKTVLGFLQKPHCLKRLKSGRPGQPLYKRPYGGFAQQSAMIREMPPQGSIVQRALSAGRLFRVLMGRRCGFGGLSLRSESALRVSGSSQGPGVSPSTG